MRTSSIFTIIAAASILVPSLSHSDVIISEVLFNEIGGDIGGEWIELYNNGDASVSLEEWTIGDEETEGAISQTEAMMFFPPGLVIEPGRFFIVAANAITFESQHGFLPDLEVVSGTAGDHPSVPNLTTDFSWDPDGGIINLSNTHDQVLLRNSEGVEADRIAWGPSTSQLDPNAEADGQSWHRTILTGGTGTNHDWALTPLEELSTPGTGPTEVVVPPFAARWEVDGAGQRILVWTEVPGSLFYEIRSSTDLLEWDPVDTVFETSWTPPQGSSSSMFYTITAR